MKYWIVLVNLTAELEELKGAGDKLRELGGLKGKIQQKITTLSKNHKFFHDNTSCPTCTQDIDEDLREDKLNELGAEAKKLERWLSGFGRRSLNLKRLGRLASLKPLERLLELNKELSTSNTNYY